MTDDKKNQRNTENQHEPSNIGDLGKDNAQRIVTEREDKGSFEGTSDPGVIEGSDKKTAKSPKNKPYM